jgi:hypothetical protein
MRMKVIVNIGNKIMRMMTVQTPQINPLKMNMEISKFSSAIGKRIFPLVLLQWSKSKTMILLLRQVLAILRNTDR